MEHCRGAYLPCCCHTIETDNYVITSFTLIYTIVSLVRTYVIGDKIKEIKILNL